MSATAPSRRTRRILGIGLLVALPGVAYVLPLFHIVPLEAAREESAAQVFDAAAFVERFWTEQLPAAVDRAVDAGELLAALRADPAAAAERFGHRLGLSGTICYLVSGTGRITAVEDRRIAIVLQGAGADSVVIKTGPVFGNAIRDGSGLLNVSEFPNSQDFNALSFEINRRVEERVFPHLNERAAVGVVVKFVGGVALPDMNPEPSPLNLVPVVVEFP